MSLCSDWFLAEKERKGPWQQYLYASVIWKILVHWTVQIFQMLTHFVRQQEKKITSINIIQKKNLEELWSFQADGRCKFSKILIFPLKFVFSGNNCQGFFSWIFRITLFIFKNIFIRYPHMNNQSFCEWYSFK